jgi:hypothetical protein
MRVHYLLDLFDDARFARSKPSLDALAAAIGQSASSLRGGRGTDRAIAALQLALDSVLAIDRLHAAGQKAQTLLAADANPIRKRAQALQRMTELKSVARDKGPLSENARLRLIDYCVRALEDARRAKWAMRTRRAAHCLYPLYESDPAPYFSHAAAERPPPPRASVLVARLRAEITRKTPHRARHARSFRHISARLEALATGIDRAIAPPPAPAALNLPNAVSATPYDWTPVLTLKAGDTLASLAATLTKLEQAMLGDGRPAIALVLPSTATGASLRLAARVASRLGAKRLELVVGLQQRLAVPKGDYWAGRTTGPVLRAGVLPVSVLTTAAPPLGRAAQGTRDWDPSRATLGLTLRVDKVTWRLSGTDGAVAEVPAGDVGQLRAALASVRQAYDYEQGLAIVPHASASYAHIVAAVDGASVDAEGRSLFPRVALLAAPPKQTEARLAVRIRHRSRARVTITPKSMMRQAKLVRRCYQNLLEKTPLASGTLRVEGATATTTLVTGTQDANLQACVQRAMVDAMRGAPQVTATVTLSSS